MAVISKVVKQELAILGDPQKSIPLGVFSLAGHLVYPIINSVISCFSAVSCLLIFWG